MNHSSLALLSSIKPSSLLADASSSDIAAVLIFFLFFGLFILIISLVLIVSLWKVYEKAGVPGWASLIPFYNQVKLLQITGKPVWWVLLMFMPIVNIVLMVIVARRLAASFGKGVGFTLGLVLLPFIFYPILAFGKSTYTSVFPAPGPMSEAVKWSLIAGFLFLLIEGFAVSAGNNFSSSSDRIPLTVISADLGYASDNNYVYYYDTPIHGADPLSFKVLGDYGIDDNHVYYEDTQIQGADPATFSLLDGGSGAYAKDDAQVYYEGSKIIGADATNFKLLDSDFAEDGVAVYCDGDVVLGADVMTFTPVVDPSGNDNYSAKDKTHYYSCTDQVTKDGK